MKYYRSKSSLYTLLEYYNQEQIMEYYNIPLFVPFCNPFRIDNNPSCTCDWYNDYLIVTDWTLEKRYNIVAIAGLVYGYITLENDVIDNKLYQTIVKDMIFELIDSKTKRELEEMKISNKTLYIKDNTNIKVYIRQWQDYDREYWNPLKIDTFNKLPVPIFPLSYIDINGTIMCHNNPKNPTYGYFFKEESTLENQIWKIYKPLDKNGFKWFSNTKHSFTNPTTITEEAKILCTSYKDSLALEYITDIPAYSYQSEVHKPVKLLPNTTHIVIDKNETGIKYGNYLADKFGLKIITPLNVDVFEDLKTTPIHKLTDYYIKQL